jgi:transcription termination/antitermination protein NusG
MIRMDIEKEEQKIKKEMQARKEEDIDVTPKIQPIVEEKETQEETKKEEKEQEDEDELSTIIYSIRTTANREEQVLDFVASNVNKKKLEVYSLIKPHGMRGYIFMEAQNQADAEIAIQGVPYARGLLPAPVKYSEIKHMLEQTKKEVNILKNDICEIISGPFKREKAKITRVDKAKEEVVVELLESAVPIPITVNIDSVKVIRRD